MGENDRFMKVLLTAVNAKYIHSNLAVYSLKAYASRFGEQIEVAEFTINQYGDYILQEIYKKKPDILAFSCYIWNIRLILDVLENVRQVLPETKIWLGGPEVSYDSEQFLAEHPEVTGIMTGEGERPFLALMEYYLEGKGSLDCIPGIVWREGFSENDGNSGPGAGMADGADVPVNEESTMAGVAERLQNGDAGNGQIRRNLSDTEYLPMDEIPFIYENLDRFSNKILYYESSRGCPFSCSYCLSSIDKRVRFRSLELVQRELQFFLDHRVPQVKFVDRTFNCNHKHALEIWQYILEHDNGVTNFHFEVEADLLTEEELKVLAKMRPGLIQLEIGVQSANEKTLEAVHRRTDFARIAEVVKEISSHHNIHQHLDLIAGLPYENYESFGRSFDMVYGLHPQELQLGFLKVLKGAGMQKDAGEYNIQYRRKPVYEVLSTPWLSYEEILKLKSVEEMLEVYYNSQQFAHTIRALEKVFASPFRLYEALAEFQERKGQPGNALSRMQRLEGLRAFAHEADPERAVWYDECLILDLYLRENAKTRPAWAEDPALRREVRTAFYKQEEEGRKYLKAYEGCNWKQLSKMTHLEHFTMEDGAPGEHWVLFDYSQRDPLTYDARHVHLHQM